MKYYDVNFTHFTELLARHDGISVSVSSVTLVLEEAGIPLPKGNESKEGTLQTTTRTAKKAAKSQRELCRIQQNLVAVENAHSRRPRCAYFGELEQMDASPYEWFADHKTTLHIAVDDASGRITGAWFDRQETLNGYYHVFAQILKRYGIPYRFYTDRRTVFTYRKKNADSWESPWNSAACHRQKGVWNECLRLCSHPCRSN